MAAMNPLSAADRVDAWLDNCSEALPPWVNRRLLLARDFVDREAILQQKINAQEAVHLASIPKRRRSSEEPSAWRQAEERDWRQIAALRQELLGLQEERQQLYRQVVSAVRLMQSEHAALAQALRREMK